MRFMRKTIFCPHHPFRVPPLKLTIISNCEPLTPEDIAEIIVFAAGRRENVVLADTLVYPNHQVRSLPL